MAKRFPITEKQFWEWLRAKPRAKAGKNCRCPVALAILDLTDRIESPFGPRWTLALTARIDRLTNYHWEKFTRGQLLKLLENSK